MAHATDNEQRPDGGLLRVEDGHGTWAADEVRLALARVDALRRELEHLETAVRSHQDDLSRLADSVHVVEGRTQRHDAAQDQTREVRHEVADLEERLTHEVSLRRDLAAQVERAHQRESETQQELQRVLQLIASRLDEFDGKVAAETHRQRAVADDMAAVEHGGQDLEARIERLERRLGSEFENARHHGTELARIAASVTQLMSALDAGEARWRAMQVDQRRLDDEVANMRGLHNREEELLEIIEQQRATRARLEDRVAQAEEALEQLRLQVAAGAEERALLARQVQGEAEQRRTLGERLEAQRDTFIDHFRREARAHEESRRRATEEMERDIRVARSLLVRLTEQTDETEQEQPL